MTNFNTITINANTLGNIVTKVEISGSTFRRVAALANSGQRIAALKAIRTETGISYRLACSTLERIVG